MGLITTPYEVISARQGSGTLFSAGAFGIFLFMSFVLSLVNLFFLLFFEEGKFEPMKQMVLFVFTQSDVESLPACASVLRQQRFDSVWVLINPSVFVDTKQQETARLKDIADLEAAISQCAIRRDWAGCSGYQAQLDAKKLEVVTAVKDAWKSLPEAARKAAEDRIVGLLGTPCGTNQRFQPLPDHYETGKFIDALHAVRQNWHAPCIPPNFSLHFASTLAKEAKGEQVTVKETPISPPAPVAAPPAPKPVKKHQGNPMMSDPRYRELVRMTPDQLGQVGIEMGLKVAGTSRQIAAQIWKAEAAKKMKLESVESY